MMTPEQIEELARAMVADTGGELRPHPESPWHVRRAHEVMVYHEEDREPWAAAALFSHARRDPLTVPLYEAVCRALEASQC